MLYFCVVLRNLPFPGNFVAPKRVRALDVPPVNITRSEVVSNYDFALGRFVAPSVDLYGIVLSAIRRRLSLFSNDVSLRSLRK